MEERGYGRTSGVGMKNYMDEALLGSPRVARYNVYPSQIDQILLFFPLPAAAGA